MGSRALEMTGSGFSGNITSPTLLFNAQSPVLDATQCQPTSHKLTNEVPLNRKRSAASFVPTTERLQAESLRWKVIRHAMHCRQVNCSEYPNGVCARAKDAVSHVAKCNNMNCTAVDCIGTRSMMKHMSQCRAKKCRICGPVQLPHSGPVVRPDTPAIISEQPQHQQQKVGRFGSSPLKKRRVTLDN
jgi:hypothetical protein